VPEDAFVVLVVASLYETTNRKAMDVQILAFQKFQEECPDANAFLFIHSANTQNNICTTPQAFPLYERAAKLGLDLSAFHWNQEVVTAEQLGEIYAMSDVLLSCSKSEGFGVPILEAQRYGLRVITSDFLSMKEHNFQGRVARVATESYNFFQAGTWTMPSHCAIAEELQKAYKDCSSGHDEKEIKARWIVRNLTSFDKVRDELAIIIK
jgi:glycosyltransferase involved in cell wall biosynthesis